MSQPSAHKSPTTGPPHHDSLRGVVYVRLNLLSFSDLKKKEDGKEKNGNLKSKKIKDGLNLKKSNLAIS